MRVIATSLFILFSSLRAQTLMQFTGSSPSQPHRMIQDRAGYIWMASYLGLTRYDGHTFKTFEHAVYDSTSLSNEIVNDLLQDRNGRLWVSTEDGINVFLPESESFRRIDLLTAGYRSNRVGRIYQTSDASYWIATLFDVLRFVPNRGTVSRFPNFDRLQYGTVRQFAEWNRRLLILTMHGKLYRYHSDTESFRTMDVSETPVERVLVDGENNLWVLSARFILRIDQNEKEAVRYRVDEVFRNREIDDAVLDGKEIWIGTTDGLFQFDTSTGKVIPVQEYRDRDYLGSRRSIISLLKDREQTLWASMQGQGIYRMSPFRPDFRIIRHDPDNDRSLSSNMIFRIYEDLDSILWIGTLDGEINRLAHDGIRRIDIQGGQVRSMTDAGDGTLWIGSSAGLERIDKQTGQTMPLPVGSDVFRGVAITDMLALNDGHWLFGTSMGAADVRMENRTLRVTWYRAGEDSNSLSSNFIFTVCRSRKGGVWIGTWDGLDYMDLSTGRIQRVTTGAGFRSGVMTSLWEDSLGRVWIGTYGHGLKVFDPASRAWKYYTKREGLPNDQIYAILPDEQGCLWLPTNNGLCRFSLADEHIRWFTEDDGIAGNEFNGGAWCRRRDGSIVLGGPRGLTVFHPRRIKINPYVPAVQIEGLEVHGTFVRAGNEGDWKLSPGDNSFEIVYNAMSYLVPDKNRFQYRLEGYDANWVDAKHRRIAPYANVPPGRYTFYVRGCNNDGVWNMAGARMHITILPEVWQTWWFVALVCIVMGSVVYGLIAFRVRQLLAVERLRATIAADLHDFVGSGLTDISILTQLVVQHLDQRTRDNVERHLIRIHETTDSIIKSFGDIIWIVNPRRDSLTDLIVRTKDFYQDVLSQLGVQFTTSNLDELQKLKLKLEKKQQLYLLIKEAIHNSLKHSQCQRIHLDISVDRTDFKISITDDGQGFRLNGHTGNGLKNMKVRARQLGGSILIRSSPGAGTRIEIQGRI